MAIRITQAGVGLTVGIIVVAALIIGGLFLVKNQGEQARREETIKVAEKNLEKQSDQEVALNEADKDENKESESNSGQGSSEESAQQEEGAASSGEQSVSSTNSGASVDELPATGPSDSFAIVVLALLTFSTAAYIQSRRQA